MTPEQKLKALQHHIKLKSLIKLVVEEMRAIKSTLGLTGLDYTVELSLLGDKLRGGVAYTGLIPNEQGEPTTVDINFEGAEEFKPLSEALLRQQMVEELLAKLTGR